MTKTKKFSAVSIILLIVAVFRERFLEESLFRDTSIIYTFSRGAQPSGTARHYACGCFFLRIASISIPAAAPATRAMR